MSRAKLTSAALKANQDQIKKLDSQIASLKKLSSQYVVSQDGGQTYKASKSKIESALGSIFKK